MVTCNEYGLVGQEVPPWMREGRKKIRGPSTALDSNTGTSRGRWRETTGIVRPIDVLESATLGRKVAVIRDR